MKKYVGAQYSGVIRLNSSGNEIRFSIWAKRPEVAVDKLLNIYKSGFSIINIRSSFFSYPELSGVEIAARSKNINVDEGPLLPGMDAAYNTIREDS